MCDPGNSPSNDGENRCQEIVNNGEEILLTRIRETYTLSTTQNAGEVDELMVKHFLEALAEISLSVASRRINGSNNKVDNA